jgi:catechol 2,3-dioxygenase-like lactoylglutathione lyase family enzyme
MTQMESAMPRVVGIDHLVLSVGDLVRSRDFYAKVLGFLNFKLTYDGGGFVGWSNGKTLFWIAEADAQGRKRRHCKGDIGFHHYAFELASRKAVDDLGAFLEQHGLDVADPPGTYNGDDKYYAVFFNDPGRNAAGSDGVRAGKEANKKDEETQIIEPSNARNSAPSCAGSARASTSSRPQSKRWMAGTSPATTNPT